jgi:prepilin-type processing-associated H-X9-DG protein
MRWPRIRWIFFVAGLIVLTIGVGMPGMTFLKRYRREADLRKGCATHLHAIWWALGGPRSETFPAGTVPAEGIPPEKRLSWVTRRYGYFDESQGVNFLFDKTASWDSEANRIPKILISADDDKESVRCPPDLLPYVVLLCPESPGYPRFTGKFDPNFMAKTPAEIHYIGIAGVGRDSPTLPEKHPRAGVFGYDRQTRMADIKDGAANTMMMAETAMAIGPWIAGGPATVRGLDPDRKPYVGKGQQFGGRHRGGASVLFVDGSVRFVRDSIAPSTFEALSTIAGGERTPNAEWGELLVPAWTEQR